MTGQIFSAKPWLKDGNQWHKIYPCIGKDSSTGVVGGKGIKNKKDTSTVMTDVTLITNFHFNYSGAIKCVHSFIANTGVAFLFSSRNNDRSQNRLPTLPTLFGMLLFSDWVIENEVVDKHARNTGIDYMYIKHLPV